MEDFITVGGVDAIAEASQRLSVSDGAFDMKTPSVAKKLKDDLLRMADGTELFVIREGDNAKQLEAKQFKTVLENEWLIKIGITANAVSQERHFNRNINLPEPRAKKS